MTRFASRSPRALVPGRLAPTRPLHWIATGWKLFLKHPGVWIMQSLIFIAVLAVLGLLPVVGPYAPPIVLPLLSAGMLAGAQALERGETLRVGLLFEGARRHAGNLLLVGVFHLLGVRLARAIGDSRELTDALVEVFARVGLTVGHDVFGMWIFIVLWALLMTALWLAPALVMLHEVAPLDAMRLSAQACFRNLLTFILFAVTLYAFIWVAVLTAGLGMLVLMPVLAGALLEAWQDTFGTHPAPPAAPA
jgi:hypothetical protein